MKDGRDATRWFKVSLFKTRLMIDVHQALNGKVEKQCLERMIYQAAEFSLFNVISQVRYACDFEGSHWATALEAMCLTLFRDPDPFRSLVKKYQPIFFYRLKYDQDLDLHVLGRPLGAHLTKRGGPVKLKSHSVIENGDHLYQVV